MNDLTSKAKQSWLRRLLALAWLMLVALGLVQPVSAAEFRSGDTVVIDADEVIDDDLFVSAQTVIVDGKVTGNLFATGTDVTVNGSVAGSLFTAGQSLTVNGAVDGSLYAAGYAFTLGPNAVVTRNLYGAGFSLTTAPGSQIGRDLYGSGYQAILNGAVTNDVNVGTAALEVNGRVGGNVRGSVGNADAATPTSFLPTFGSDVAPVPPGLRLGDNAQVTGEVAVETPTASATAAAPFYSPANPRTRWMLGELITLLIVGTLLLWLRPTWLRRTSTAAQRWLPSLGMGLLTILASVVLIPLALVVIILLAIAGGWLTFGQLTAAILGVGLATLVFAVVLLFFATGILSKIIAAYLGGRLLLQRSLTPAHTGMDFVALALGLVIYSVLRAIPFGIGWVIGALVTLLGLGAILIMLRRTPRPQAVMAAPTAVSRRREVPA